MWPVGIGSFAWDDGLETVGEGVLCGRANAHICLHAADDHAFHALLGQEQCKIGGEERAEPAFEDSGFARSLRTKLAEEFGVLCSREVVNGQFAPLEVVEYRPMQFHGMDNDGTGAPRLRPQLW